MKSLGSKKLEYNCTECFNNIAVLKVDEGKKESLFLFKIWQIHSLSLLSRLVWFFTPISRYLLKINSRLENWSALSEVEISDDSFKLRQEVLISN